MEEGAEPGFVLARGCVDMGEMNASQVAEHTESARSWARAFAQSHGTSAREWSADSTIRSFDVFVVGGLDLWLLHNRFVSVVGVVTSEPKPGRGWAVGQTFVDISVPEHLQGWGPEIARAENVNAELTEQRWGTVSTRAREYADRYKPETVGQVLFNYWD